MDELETKAQAIVAELERNRRDSWIAGIIGSDKGRRKLVISPWRRFLMRPRNINTIVCASAVIVTAAGWVVTALAGGFEPGATNWWWVVGVWLMISSVASFSAVPILAVEGIYTGWMEKLLLKTNCSPTMLVLVERADREAQRIRDVAGKRFSAKALQEKLGEIRAVAQVEHQAMGVLQSALVASQSTTSATDYLNASTAERKATRDLMAGSNAQYVLDAEETIHACHLEVAKALVALTAVADAETSKEAARKQLQAAEELLARAHKEQANLDKKFVNGVPTINTGAFMEHAEVANQQRLAETKATQEIHQRLAE